MRSSKRTHDEIEGRGRSTTHHTPRHCKRGKYKHNKHQLHRNQRPESSSNRTTRQSSERWNAWEGGGGSAKQEGPSPPVDTFLCPLAYAPARLAPLSRSCGLPLMQNRASRGTYRNPSAPDYQERPALPPSLFEKITRFTNAKAKAKANVGGVTQASAVCMCNSAAEMHLLLSHLPTSVSVFSGVAGKSQFACSCDRWWSPSVGEGPPNRPNRALLGAAPPNCREKGRAMCWGHWLNLDCGIGGTAVRASLCLTYSWLCAGPPPNYRIP